MTGNRNMHKFFQASHDPFTPTPLHPPSLAAQKQEPTWLHNTRTTITEPPFPKSCNSIFHWAYPFAFGNSGSYKLSNSTSDMSTVFLGGWFGQGLVVGVWHWFWPHLFQKCHRMSHRGKDFESTSRKSHFGRLELVFPGAHADCLWIFWNLKFDI